MKTALTILALVIHACYINAQTYFNLQGGVAENKQTDNTTLTYQAGFRHQFSNIGFKATFGQTDGLYHTFDSYTLSGTYQPLEGLYASAGYRHDNGRWWGDDRNGLVLGLNALIPIMDGANIIATVEPYFSDIIITNIMVGIQLDFRLSKNKKTNRFF